MTSDGSGGRGAEMAGAARARGWQPDQSAASVGTRKCCEEGSALKGQRHGGAPSAPPHSSDPIQPILVPVTPLNTQGKVPHDLQSAPSIHTVGDPHGACSHHRVLVTLILLSRGSQCHQYCSYWSQSHQYLLKRSSQLSK
ncbi:hypothetical protein Nmel_018192 [Mimus melanotis]